MRIATTQLAEGLRVPLVIFLATKDVIARDTTPTDEAIICTSDKPDSMHSESQNLQRKASALCQDKGCCCGTAVTVSCTAVMA